MQESPILDLAKDCSLFVTRRFEIISISSPHIYHSALQLTPRETIVQKLYKPHVQPLVRVVHGAPALWDSHTAAATIHSPIELAAWSPCNKFIAVSKGRTMTVDILDSKTLQRLQILETPREVSSPLDALVFSPDSRTLTSFIRINMDTRGLVVNWDLQTGGIVSVIERDNPCRANITYSRNGEMIAVLSRYESSTTISIYNVVSGVYMHGVDHRAHTSLETDPGVPYNIWTYGGSLRFATPEPTGITIWEVGFSPGAAPMEVETVSIPEDTAHALVFKPEKRSDVTFHPASCRLAFIGAGGTLLVWGARASKFLLNHAYAGSSISMTFSSNGHFFAHTTEAGVCLWRESPTGYTLFQKFAPATQQYYRLYFSPDEESILAFNDSMIQSWNTKSCTIAAPGLTAQIPQHTGEGFVLEFHPDGHLASAARKGDRTVMVLDLHSGLPRLTVDTSIEVYGLRSIENAIVVIGDERAIAWDLPRENFPPNPRVNIEDNTKTIHFGKVGDCHRVIAASISLDFRYIAHAVIGPGSNQILSVYCTFTGRNIRVETDARALWFAPGGHNIWCVADKYAREFAITQDTLHCTGAVVDIEEGSRGFPWGSSRGYKVAIDGWIFRRDGKRLLKLPPLWQSAFEVDRVWNGKFLAFVHGELPELVILELEP